MVRVALAGGGTAGHTSPLIATAEALQTHDSVEGVVCIGTPKGLENRVIPEAGLPLELVDPVPLPRRISGDLFKVPNRLNRAVKQAGDILRNNQVDVLVGFGGYVAMPAYFAARRMNIPIVIHEQNAVPGLANRVAARFARRVLTAFPGSTLRNAEFIGMPIRRSLSTLAQKGRGSEAIASRELFDLDPGLPTLLVSGGSQGARSINNATIGAIEPLLAAGVQILHVWGPKNYTSDLTMEFSEANDARYVPVAYVDRMEQAYAAADLMVGRSGAGTVVETAAVGLPSIFVPLPHGNGEQARNADPLLDVDAAAVVADAEFTSDRMVKEVLGRIKDSEALEAMSTAAQAIVPADAADRVAQIVLDEVRR